MLDHHSLTRRNVLKGLGTALALPWLESLVPPAVAAAGKAPTRLGFVYVPNGVHWKMWHVEGAGRDFELPPSLRPLQDVRDQVLFFRGLTLDQGRDHGDGGGDHPRATASFLTAAHAHKSFGKEIRVNGISVDQLAAGKIGTQTRLPSLELACERPQPPGMCDAGYSGVYRNAISWRSPTTPVPTEINPRLAFLRLFGDPRQGRGAAERARHAMQQSSVLDLVCDEARALHGQIGGADRRKLDEYLHSVREVERQIQAAERIPPRELPAGTKAPDGIPPQVPDHIRVMLDLMVLAFQTDSTRIISVMLANGGSDRSFPFIGVQSAHHHYSHHEGKPENLEALHKIDQFYVAQYAYLVKKLAAVKEGTGTLLDNCLVLYGCPLRDGNKHERHDLPILLAGSGGGIVTPGRAIPYPAETPLANLFLTMLDSVGCKQDRFSDSTGRLANLRV